MTGMRTPLGVRCFNAGGMTMKKITLITVAAMSFLGLVSCEKNGIIASDGHETLSFVAEIPQTKTVLSGYTTLWEFDDEIAVYNGTSCATFTNDLGSGTGASATYSGTLSSAASYIALYPVPASNVYGFTDEEWAASGPFTVTGPVYTIPASQTAVTDGIQEGLDVLVASTTSSSLSFKHACAALKFTVGPSSPAITEIIVEGAKIAGKYRYLVDSDAQESFSGSTGAISLSMGGTAFPEGDYYIMIAARNYSSGLAFTFRRSDGKVATATKAGSLTPEIGHVYPMGTIGGLNFQTVLASKPDIGDMPTGENGIVAYVDDLTKKAYLLSMDEPSDGTWAVADTWITTKGTEWNMPSRPLLSSMREAILGEMTLDAFNDLITGAAGTAITKTGRYWTSTLNGEGTKAYIYRFNKSDSDTSEYYELVNLTGTRKTRAYKVLNYNE